MNRSTASHQKGFSLIELMVTVAIVGLLAATAMPSYQGYMIRAQVSEGLTLSEGMKTAIAEFFNDRGIWPANNITLGMLSDTSGSYVSSISSSSGQITIIFGNKAHTLISTPGANQLTLTAAVQNVNNTQIVSWVCGYATPPGSAISTGSNATTLPEKYLPQACK